jgi:hypothetical protein
LKNIFIGILIFSIFSCKNNRYKALVVQAYQLENEKSENPIKIKKIKILTSSEVGRSYGDTLVINHLLFRNKMDIKIITTTESTIKLLDANIERYQKILKICKKGDIPKYKMGLDSTRNRLESQQKKLSDLKEKLKNTTYEIDDIRDVSRTRDTLNKLKMIKYLIIASNESMSINDTISVIFDDEGRRSFIKNDMYCDYLGN